MDDGQGQEMGAWVAGVHHSGLDVAAVLVDLQPCLAGLLRRTCIPSIAPSVSALEGAGGNWAIGEQRARFRPLGTLTRLHFRGAQTTLDQRHH